jgi:hypothetical protein
VLIGRRRRRMKVIHPAAVLYNKIRQHLLFGGTVLSLNANKSEPLNENIFTALLAFVNVAGRAPDSQSVFRKTPEVSMALYLGLVGLHKLGCGACVCDHDL